MSDNKIICVYVGTKRTPIRLTTWRKVRFGGGMVIVGNEINKDGTFKGFKRGHSEVTRVKHIIDIDMVRTIKHAYIHPKYCAVTEVDEQKNT